MRTAQGRRYSNDRLEYYPDTGKLGTRKIKTEPDHAIYPSLSEEGFSHTYKLGHNYAGVIIYQYSPIYQVRMENCKQHSL